LEDLDFDMIMFSIKASSVPMTIAAYRLMSQKTPYPLHIGVTEAGTPFKGTIKSAAGLGCLLAEGIGDALTELEPFPPVSLVLVKPKIGVSTQWVYRNLRLNEITDRPDTDLLISAIRQKRPDIVAENMVNVLETVTAKRFKIIREIEEKLMEHGALGSMMSGSGPTVFGIFGNRISAENAYEALKSSRWDTILTETIREGGTV
jgi:4-diphosphocytidyl-2C-methyl-D-erythritol kinase